MAFVLMSVALNFLEKAVHLILLTMLMLSLIRSLSVGDTMVAAVLRWLPKSLACTTHLIFVPVVCQVWRRSLALLTLSVENVVDFDGASFAPMSLKKMWVASKAFLKRCS